MEESSQNKEVWWGTFSLDENQAGRWCVGPSSIWIHRSMQEWRIAHEEGSDPLDQSIDVTVPFAGEEAPWLIDRDSEEVKLSRFSFRRTEAEVRIQPLLADRAIVVRPSMPLYIPEGETVSLFVSTPLWMRIEAGKPLKTLHELPLFRPSDTWFGPNTMEGEMCYNTRTNARLRLEDVPLRRHRAVTSIRIRNKADTALYLERVRIPVQHLSLFSSEDGFLWTQLVTLERMKGDEQATLHVGEGAPKEISGTKLIAKPRISSKSNLITRPFSMLFHKVREA